jgi:hypothetical protein
MLANPGSRRGDQIEGNGTDESCADFLYLDRATSQPVAAAFFKSKDSRSQSSGC